MKQSSIYKKFKKKTMSMGGNSQPGNLIRKVLKQNHKHPFKYINEIIIFIMNKV